VGRHRATVEAQPRDTPSQFWRMEFDESAGGGASAAASEGGYVPPPSAAAQARQLEAQRKLKDLGKRAPAIDDDF
jgi:hypothetical protein